MHTTAIAMTAILWLGGIAVIAPLHVVDAIADADAYVTCHGGSANFEFSPGVTFKRTTTQVAGTGDLGVCNSAKSPKITGGIWRFIGSGMGACPGPFSVGFGKMQISWNDGSTSTIPQASFRAEAFTWSFVGGSVAEGSFKGSTVRANGRSTTSAIEMGAQCITSGLTTYSGGTDTFSIGAI